MQNYRPRKHLNEKQIKIFDSYTANPYLRYHRRQFECLNSNYTRIFVEVAEAISINPRLIIFHIKAQKIEKMTVILESKSAL